MLGVRRGGGYVEMQSEAISKRLSRPRGGESSLTASLISAVIARETHGDHILLEPRDSLPIRACGTYQRTSLPHKPTFDTKYSLNPSWTHTVLPRKPHTDLSSRLSFSSPRSSSG